MITMLVMMNMTMTIMFIMMKHPLSTGGILLTQTIIISLISGNLYQNFWFSYILFLIMIGGMLILFMYMTSIASNEKFKINLKMTMVMMIIPVITWMMMDTPEINMVSKETIESNKQTMFEMTLTKFINFPLTLLMLFLMIYLLLAMIATVKITSFKQGSIRQMN